MLKFRKYCVCAAIVAAILCLEGCDAMRWLAGRPTGKEIETMRAAREAAIEEAHLARLDSLEKVEKAMADSLAALDSLKKEGAVLRSSLGKISRTELDRKYYIVIGSFLELGNAEYQKSKAQKAGYEALCIAFDNGYTAVGVSPCDSPTQIRKALEKLRGEKFCPKDAWILVNGE